MASGPIISRSKEVEVEVDTATATAMGMGMGGHDDPIPFPSTGETSSGPSLSKTIDYRKRTVSKKSSIMERSCTVPPSTVLTFGRESPHPPSRYHLTWLSKC